MSLQFNLKIHSKTSASHLAQQKHLIQNTHTHKPDLKDIINQTN